MAKVVRALLPIVITCGLLEGLGYWLTPNRPAADSLEGRSQRFADEVYVPDAQLVVRLAANLRSNFDRYFPGSDAPLTTNSHGFRGEEWTPTDANAYRIMVFGDSVTFGFCLTEQQAWPNQLLAALSKHTTKPIQLRNLAVPGYSSLQSRVLFEQAHTAEFAPHLVIFASGWNDSYLKPLSDASMRDAYAKLYGTTGGAIVRGLRKSWLLSYLLDRLRKPPDAAATERVTAAQLQDNLAAVCRTCKAKGQDILLIDSCLPNRYPASTFAAVAKEHGVAMLSFRDVFEVHRQVLAGGAWPKDGVVDVIVPSHGIAIPASPDDRPQMYLLLLPSADQRLHRERVALHDDGRDGDATAGDGLWSARVRGQVGQWPQFALSVPGLAAQLPMFRDDAALLNGVFFWSLPWIETVGDQPGSYREDRVSSGSPWPELTIGSDPIHPTSAGNELLAQAVEAAVQQIESWRTFTR